MSSAAAVNQLLVPVAAVSAVAAVGTALLGWLLLRQRPSGARPAPAVYGVALAAVVAGLLVALVGEGLGGSILFVLVGGVVSLVGVGVLTATVAALPDPDGGADASH